jgi:hypothetical protein
VFGLHAAVRLNRGGRYELELLETVRATHIGDVVQETHVVPLRSDEPCLTVRSCDMRRVSRHGPYILCQYRLFDGDVVIVGGHAVTIHVPDGFVRACLEWGEAAPVQDIARLIDCADDGLDARVADTPRQRALVLADSYASAFIVTTRSMEHVLHVTAGEVACATAKRTRY